VAKACGSNLVPIDGRELTDVCVVTIQKTGLPFPPTFLEREWRQVILAQGLRDEQAYLTCSRAGQGTPLGKAQRRQVWQAPQSLKASLRLMGRDAFPQLADEAARAAQPLYEHITSLTRPRICTRRSGGYCGPWSRTGPTTSS
jgi:hypothetical protein